MVHSDAVTKKMVDYAFQVLWICLKYRQVLCCTLNLMNLYNKWINSTCVDPLQLIYMWNVVVWSILGLIGRIPSHVAKVSILAHSTSDLRALIHTLHTHMHLSLPVLGNDPGLPFMTGNYATGRFWWTILYTVYICIYIIKIDMYAYVHYILHVSIYIYVHRRYIKIYQNSQRIPYYIDMFNLVFRFLLTIWVGQS